MAETVLAKMAVEISANAANFTKQLQATESKLNSFANNLSNTAKSIGIAFGVQQVASFAFEVAKLAGEAEGVRAAFEKLPDSAALMNQLKDATAGTVSELELMKRTVQATNFGIQLEALPQLLEFAAIRAQQTGQSVDYLVDSIVTGIGRKSPLILDNLGISAVRLKEKLGDVSIAAADVGTVSQAVGAIAAEELEKMGGFSENTATKVARLSASWEDFKVTLGNTVNSGGLLANVLDDLTGILRSFANGEQANFIQFQKNLAESIKNDSEPAIKTMMRELNLLRNELKTPISESFAKTLVQEFKLSEEQGARFLKIIKEINGETKKVVPPTVVKTEQIVTLESLQEKVKELNETFATTNVVDQQRLSNIGKEIIAVNAQIKKLEELRKAREASGGFQPDTVDAYQDAISKLSKELEGTNVKDLERIRILSAQISGYEKAIARVNELKNSFKDFDVVLKRPDTSALNDIFDTTTGKLKEFKNEFGTLTHTSTIMDEVTKRFEDKLARMANAAQTRTTEIKKAFIDMGPLISGALSGIGEALGGAIAGTENFGQAILKVVTGFAKQLGEILIATGVAMIAAKTLISNPYTAIIAGIALVALASAASAAIGSAHSKSFGGSGGATSGRGGSTSTGVERFSRNPTEQVILVGGEIKWNGNTLALALDRAYKAKERTG